MNAQKGSQLALRRDLDVHSRRKPLAFFSLFGCALLALGLIAWRGSPPAGQPPAPLLVNMPDLIVVSITSAQVLDGCPLGPAGLLVTIRNQGTFPAVNFQTTLTGGSTTCTPWTLASLAPDEEHTFFCPAGMPGASIYTATVDSGGAVAESDETNNQLTDTVWVITLPTCTPTATPTQTPTLAPTGWLGPLILSGHVREEGSLAPVSGALIGGYVLSQRGGGGTLPIVTAQPDGSYALQTGFGIYDTDTVRLDASAAGYEDASAQRTGLQAYSGGPIDLTLRRIVLTPTPTPTSSTFLHITVSLQGRPPAPHPSWQTPLTVTLYVGDTIIRSERITCDQTGALRLLGLLPRVHNVQIKGPNTLSNVKESLLLLPGPNDAHMGLLRAGDGNGDDRVNILDFSLLRVLYGGTDPRADFNNDGIVDILDFSLLRTNFGMVGPILLP